MEPTDAFPHWQTSCVEGREGPCTGHRRAGACAVRRAPPLDVCVPVWVAPARGGRSRRATADSDVGSTVELQDSERRLLGAPALRLHCRGQDLARGPWLGLASWEALWAAP